MCSTIASSSGVGVAIVAAGAQRASRRFERVQALPAPADEEFLGHGEMQKADFIGHTAKPADQIGEHAINTRAVGMQLLMSVGGKQQLSRHGGQLGT